MSKTDKKRPLWVRISAPFAVVAVAGVLGTVVIAPEAFNNSAAAVPFDPDFKQRIHQRFVPNANVEDDLVYTDVDVKILPDPEEEKRKKAEETAKAAGAATPPRYTGGGSPAEWMAAAGIAEADWGYVDYIISRESSWNPNAMNASSGACGLAQALPCSKVPGSGLNPIDNLRWANGYAIGRYGSWAQAYAFWASNHWW